jgi:hypothetical protein
MSTKERGLLSLLLIGVLASFVGFGVFGAFSSTTTNPNNNFSTGSVVLSDNDAGAALYTVTGAKPGDSVTRCIKVTYTGNLPADVHLYTTSTIGALGQYIDLTITPGTQASSTFPDCTGFTPAAGGAIYTGTLQNFGSTKNSYANGVVSYPGSQTQWNQNDAVVYRFVATLQNTAPDTTQSQSTGTHTFTWEARNQ